MNIPSQVFPRLLLLAVCLAGSAHAQNPAATVASPFGSGAAQTIAKPQGVSVLGQSVRVVNSFQDATITGGAQAVYGNASANVVNPGVEFSSFVGFYDIDVKPQRVTMKLVNNSNATSLVLPDGRYDRYYFGFSSKFVTAVLDGNQGLNAHARILSINPGETLNLVDAFGTGIALPIIYPNGGFVVELGPGTDLSKLGKLLKVKIVSATALSIDPDSED